MSQHDFGLSLLLTVQIVAQIACIITVKYNIGTVDMVCISMCVHTDNMLNVCIDYNMEVYMLYVYKILCKYVKMHSTLNYYYYSTVLIVISQYYYCYNSEY